MAIVPPVASARAQDAQRGVSIIADAEVERLLRDYTKPIFAAAGVKSGAAKVILVGDRSFNAFVADGQKIFVNIGAIIDAKTPNELIGVLAHETGHIAGGHLSRMAGELRRAQIMSIAGLLVSGATAIGAGRSSRVGMDDVGMNGIMLGPQELVQRSLLSYQRSEEQAADSAALKYLAATGQSGKGMLTTFERFSSDMLFKKQQMDPYLQSHPMASERVSALERSAKESPHFNKLDPPALQARHDLARAKLIGFAAEPSETQRRYPITDGSIAARYARAISAYKWGRQSVAQAEIDSLIRAQPANPYFWELKGQSLLEAGRAADSLGPLRKALSLSSGANPIRVLLGRALVAMDDPKHTKEAIGILARAAQEDPDSGEAYQFLAMAYRREGKEAEAMVAASQSLFASGRYVEARTQASRAQDRLPIGSPLWRKAEDILNYRPPSL